MLSIHAYYTESKVFIDRKKEYAVGEILTAYLNTDYYDMIKEEGLVNRLRKLCVSLIICDDMSSNDITNYNTAVYDSMRIFAQIKEWIYTLPPYNKSLQKPMPEFEYFLNNYQMLFEPQNKNVSMLNYDTYHLTEFVPRAKKKFKSYLKETLIDFEKKLN